jgi:enolase
MNALIKSLIAFTEYDSGGNLTLAGKLELTDGRSFWSSMPNHLSKTKVPLEFLEASKAAKYINELIAPKLLNVNPMDHQKIDTWLDKIDQTPNKQIIGANTTLLISKLLYRAGAAIAGVELFQYLQKIFRTNFYNLEIKSLPTPLFNLISGGAHGSPNLNFQEFGVVFSSSLSYAESVERGAAIHRDLEKVFQYRNIFTGVGVDGAYVPNLSSNFDALEIIKEAVLKNGYKIGLDIFFALDVAANFFYKGSRYYLSEELGAIDTKGMLDLYEKIFREYRFLVLEDPFVETDTAGWKEAVSRFGEKSFIMGDDLLVSQPQKLEKAAKEGLCSLADSKLTLSPTVWKAFEFVGLAKKLLLKTVISQTAYETNDDFVSDFSVAVQADYVKFGPLQRGERVAKHNRLLAIERLLKRK